MKSLLAELKPENTKVRQDRLLQEVPLADVVPSEENDQVYRPLDPLDPGMVALAESIRKHGLREPLVITLDGYLLSGHRRRFASQLAGLRKVPCRVEPIKRFLTNGDINPTFLVLLTEYNRQREKSLDEDLREEVIAADPHEAYESLLDYRREASRIDVATMKIPATNAASGSARPRRRCWQLSVGSSKTSKNTGRYRIGGSITRF